MHNLEAELDAARRKAAKAQKTIASLEEQLLEQSEAGVKPSADGAALKRQNPPKTPKTTEFLVRGRKTEIKLGGHHLGIVQKIDGFYVATYLWGDLIVPRTEHTLVKTDKEGNAIEFTPVPVGPFLKTVRDAVIARFFPAPQAVQ